MHKILIVEDTLAVREEIYDILILEGYNVFQAKDGLEGYEMALKENPDLIISDILMPKLNGFEMFKKLQKHQKIMNIPLIFLSAIGEKEDIKTGMNLGAEDYLTKPINVNDLVNAAENIIKKKLIIDKTTTISNTFKNQQNQLNIFSPLILNGVASSKNNVLDLLAWTQKELQETNNFRDSNIKIDKKWNKLSQIKYSSINTNTIAERAIKKINKPSHITITIKTPLPSIFANELMLEKVFEILLQNTINQIHNKIDLIELSCETTEKESVFSITYNYLKINIEHHKNVFEEFKILESSKSIRVKLNVAEKIISHHKGTFYIKTMPNKETIFYFKLPKTTNNV